MSPKNGSHKIVWWLLTSITAVLGLFVTAWGSNLQGRIDTLESTVRLQGETVSAIDASLTYINESLRKVSADVTFLVQRERLQGGKP